MLLTLGVSFTSKTSRLAALNFRNFLHHGPLWMGGGYAFEYNISKVNVMVWFNLV